MHMTHLKKSLALLLAIIMMFSSMSVAASAATSANENNTVDFNIKFYRMERNADGLIIDKFGNVVGDKNDVLASPDNDVWPGAPFDYEEMKDTMINWIETDVAKPGERVKARLFMTTDYPTTAGETAIVLDASLLSPDPAKFSYSNPATVDLEFNSNHLNGELYEVKAYFVPNEMDIDINKDNRLALNFTEDGAYFFRNEDGTVKRYLIRSNYKFKSMNTVIANDAANWAYSYDLVVNGTGANTVGTVAEVRVPEEFAFSTKNKEYMIINIMRGNENESYMTAKGMWTWDANVQSNPGDITTTTYFDLDANGGAFDSTGTIKTHCPGGIVGTSFKGFGDIKPSKAGYTFKGWTEVPVPADGKITAEVAAELGLEESRVGTYLSEEEFTEILVLPQDYHNYTYNYNTFDEATNDYKKDKNGNYLDKNGTFYAAYQKMEAEEVSYDWEIYKLKVGGDPANKADYELASSIPETVKLGETVSKPDISGAMEGFKLNETLSDKELYVDSDSLKLKQYYARKEYKVVYHYTDASMVEQTEEFTVLYGNPIPDCKANPSKEGWSFAGWSLNSDNTAAALPLTMPELENENDAINAYAYYSKNLYTYTFNAVSTEGVAGSFSKDPDDTLKAYYPLEHGSTFTETVPEPSAPGYEFAGWEIEVPDTVTESLEFKAMYNVADYDVIFMDDGKEVGRVVKYYNEQVTEADMPHGYTTEGWSLDDGETLAKFPYTVTDDVTFNAVPDVAGYHDAVFMVDGEEYDRISVKFDAEIPVPEAPSKVGHNFLGWDPDVGSGQVMDEDGEIFDALFEKKKVTITFYTDRGATPEEDEEFVYGKVTKDYDEEIFIGTGIPKKEGYEFVKWDTEIPNRMPAEDLAITAIWTPATFKVDYVDKDAEGNVIKLFASKNFKYGETIVNISNPSKEGYTFKEWTGLPEDMTMPAENIEAVANWDVNQYTITFSSEEGEKLAEPINENFGTAITEPEVTMEGKTLLGWALADDDSKTLINFPETMPAKDMNLVAVWSTDTFTVTFDAAGGAWTDDSGKTSSVYTVKNVPYNTVAAAPADPTRDGWNFKGWMPEVGAITADTTYTAVWERGEVDYTINIVGINPATNAEISFAPVTGKASIGDIVKVWETEEPSGENVVPYKYADLAPSDAYVPAPEKCTATEMTIVDGTNELTIYFKLNEEIKVTFNANGGYWLNAEEEKYDKVDLTGTYGTAFTKPADPARTGYKFVKWDKDVLATFTEDTIYNAVWTEETYNAIFNVTLPDGTTDTITVPYKYGETITAPDYSDKVGAGQSFSGWVVPEGTTMGAGNMTFTATLSDNLYKISYTYTTSAPGAITPDAQEVKLNGKVNLAEATEVKGYTFDGWYYDNEKVEEGSEFTLTEAKNVTLTGKYTAIEYAVNFVTGVEGVTVPSMSKPAGETVVLPQPTAEGKTFRGWMLNGVLYTPGTPLLMPAENVTLVAEWKDNDPTIQKYDVTYIYTGDVPATADELPTASKADEKSPVTVKPIPAAVEGYTFEGWYYNGKITESFVMPSASVELEGKWTKIPTHSITYKYTGNVPETAAALPAASTAMEKATVNVAPVPAEVDGYTFAGWYYNGRLTESFVMPESDVEIEGRWTKNPVPGEYTVTYKYSGDVPANAPALPEQTSAAENTKVTTAAIPEVDGYIFEGWYYNNKLTESFIMPSENVEIVGKWTKKTEYTISYDYVGQYDETTAGIPALPADQVAMVGKGADIAAAPTAEGYTFSGWYYNGVKYDGVTNKQLTMPNHDVVMVGSWTKDVPGEYNVTYSYTGKVPENAPAVPTLETVKIGADVVVEALPTLEGYTFDGWYYNGTKYDGNPNTKFPMPEHDVTITGSWTANAPDAYDVTYVYTGTIPTGAPDAPATESVKIGADVVVADLPTLEGYTFDGWYYNGTKYDGSTETNSFKMPAANAVITGSWTKNAPETYGVIYSITGAPAGVAAPTDSKKYEAGENVTVKAAAAVENYTFDGWYLGTEKLAAGESFEMVEGGVTLTGKYSEIIPETYTVTYEYKGTVPTDAPAEPVDNNKYEAGATVTVQSTMTMDGYTFGGWYYNGVKYDSENPVLTMPAHNVTLVGEWTPNEPGKVQVSYSYTGNVPEGAPAVPKAEWADEGSNVTVEADPVLEGYTFNGWLLNGEEVTVVENISGNVTLKGSWIPKEYSLIFDANGGTWADGQQQVADTVATNEAITVPGDPVKEGFVIDYWLDQDGNKYDRDGSVYEKLPEKMPASDMTFTAHWVEADKPTHTITYYLVKNGNVYDSATYTEGATMAHPTVGVVEGVIYEGWVDADGNPIPNVMGKSDIVAYAVPVGTMEYKATFIVDGEVYDEKMVHAGSNLVKPASPSKEGYVFAGWEPDVPAIMPANDVTFTATFEKIPDPETGIYIATYFVDGEEHKAYSVKAGDPIPVPPTPQKFGMKFVGWEPEVPSEMPANNIEFEAQWEVDEAFVTVVIGGTVVAGGVIAAIAGTNAAWITGVSIVGGILVIVGTAALIKHTHTVTFIVDGEVYKTYKVVEGTKIPVPADPVKDGAEFKGWNPEVPEKMGNTDLVFEATWGDVAADDDGNVDVDIPATGSAAGIAAFAAISGAAAAAYVITRKKKED